MLLTRPPLDSKELPPSASFDLHVLSTPPAFILSQDQTLHLKCFASAPDLRSDRLMRVKPCMLKTGKLCFFIKSRKKTSGTLYSVFKEPRPRAFRARKPRRSTGATSENPPPCGGPFSLFAFPPPSQTAERLARSVDMRRLTHRRTLWKEPTLAGEREYRGRGRPCQGISKKCEKANSDRPFLGSPCTESCATSGPLFELRKHPGDGLRIGPMLLGQDPRRQGFLRISLKDRHFSLKEDRAGVSALVHVVDRAAGFGLAGLERPTLGVETRVLRQQRRMDVEDPRPLSRHELAREEPHVAREADELGLLPLQDREHRVLVFAPRR